MINTENFILSGPLYKHEDFLALRPGTSSLYAVYERAYCNEPQSQAAGFEQVSSLFGLLVVLKKLSKVRITRHNVLEAYQVCDTHGLKFNEAMWRRICEVHQGKLPVRIKAIKEGVILPPGRPLVCVESLDAQCAPVVMHLKSSIEALGLYSAACAKLWATKWVLSRALSVSADDPNYELPSKLIDLTTERCTGEQAAMIGAAHLIHFSASSNLEAIATVSGYYNSKFSGYSPSLVQASSIVSWTNKGEQDAYNHIVSQYRDHLTSCAVVCDAHDIYGALGGDWLKTIKTQVVDHGQGVNLCVYAPYVTKTINPSDTLVEILDVLESKVSSTINKKGYRVLNGVRLMVNYDLNPSSLDELIQLIHARRLSLSNLYFALTDCALSELIKEQQHYNYELSSSVCDDKRVELTRSLPYGQKTKSGRVDLIKLRGSFCTEYLEDNVVSAKHSCLDVVFENGELLRDQTLNELREHSIDALQKPIPLY